MNYIFLTGKIYNIKYFEDIHLIKFDLASYLKSRSKYMSSFLRLACELWHQDRVIKDLKEGNLYMVVGKLKEYVFPKNEMEYKYKYAIDCIDVIKMENMKDSIEEKGEKAEGTKEKIDKKEEIDKEEVENVI